MTNNPNTLVSESFVCKELSQGHQAGYPWCVGDADQYLVVWHQSQVRVKRSMLNGTPKDN